MQLHQLNGAAGTGIAIPVHCVNVCTCIAIHVYRYGRVHVSGTGTGALVQVQTIAKIYIAIPGSIATDTRVTLCIAICVRTRVVLEYGWTILSCNIVQYAYCNMILLEYSVIISILVRSSIKVPVPG